MVPDSVASLTLFLYLDNSHNLFYRSYTGDADSVFVRAHNLNVA